MTEWFNQVKWNDRVIQLSKTIQSVCQPKRVMQTFEQQLSNV
jgi:hypothetical protein